MTTATDTPEVEKLQADNRALCQENAGLISEIEQLRGQLGEARYLTPYDLPADVLAVLTSALPGSRPWLELAELIEQRAPSWSRTA